MKKLSIIISIIYTFVTSVAFAAEPPFSFSGIVEKTSSAVVNISSIQNISSKDMELGDMPDNPNDFFDFFEKQFNNRGPRKAKSLGSGFIIDKTGFIVTNYHIVADSEEVEVMLGANDEGEVFKAKVIGKDPKTDIALLKINANRDLPYVEFGDSDEAKVGDWVIAIGNPFGLGGTVTAGIISAKARYLNNSQFDEFIQTDASINKGNSGGPMFNMQGQVIGVNTMILSTSGGSLGIGFAIPSSMVKKIVNQLKSNGKIVRGYLGVKIQPVEDKISKGLGFNNLSGALVAEISKDSPADKAGVRIGDIITKFDGKPVKNMHKLPRIVAETEVDKKVTMEVFRNGKYLPLEVVVRKLVDSEDKEVEAKETSASVASKVVMGLKVAEINDALRSKYKIQPGLYGIVVIGVNNNSPLLSVGIMPGDVLMQINRQKINTIADFESAANAIKRSESNELALLVSRKGETRFYGFSYK